ncbi:SAM-dependent methyltransferase [Catenulispora sp. EB89]|uniref:class I SAM-dependent methyltransferase n=1 Tax=Catenulispora sp. EB89 TaxID=3156257 RepID=UPI003514ED92
MDWSRDFYSTTGRWWGPAESGVTERDHERVALVRTASAATSEATTMLELGCGYGSTAALAARSGFQVLGIDISDRLQFARRYLDEAAPGTLGFAYADFYRFAARRRFDVICYWNGFGIGTDADQRVLLRRIAQEWLAPGGVALIDVANPLAWSRWAGEVEHKAARPQDGYRYALTERIDFDPIGCRYIDTWWEQDHPERAHTQTGRCYTPADFELLLAGTGLTLNAAYVNGVAIGDDGDAASRAGLLTERHEWLAVLRADDAGCAGD